MDRIRTFWAARKPKRLTTLVMMLIIWAGFAGALFAGITTDIAEKGYLKSRAVTIAAILEADQLENLQGDETDLKATPYQEVKNQLQRVRGENKDLRFIRIVQRHENTVNFAVDSEIAFTRDYTSPGQPYASATDRLFASFDSTDPTMDGPFKDEWGVWMAAYAPITVPGSSQSVGVVAIYAPAYSYYFKLAIYTLIPLLLAAIPLAGILRDRKLEAKEQEIIALKNQFVSIASHELRSPVTGMLWAIQSLLAHGKGLKTDQKTLLTDMYHSTEYSLATVNEILDLSVFERSQSGKLEREVVDMVSVVNQVIKTLKLGADEKGIKTELMNTWPEQAFVKGDVVSLKRALMNIVANAIKYSPDKSTVEFRYKHRNNQHIMSIKDYGIGIPAEEQSKVLDGYYRASNAVQAQKMGTGIGLWMTRLIIEEHGGQLALKSNINQGTTISISLPVGQPLGEATSSDQAEPSALTT